MKHRIGKSIFIAGVDGDDHEDVDEEEQEEGGDCGVFSRDIYLQVIM